MEQQVRLCEVGPRDGLQMARGMMAADDKLCWIRQLAAAGLREIEVGGFVSPLLVPQMADTGQVLPQALAIDGVTVCALACNLKGAIAAYEAGAHVIAIPVSVSDTHSHANVGKGTDAQVEAVAAIATGCGRRRGRCGWTWRSPRPSAARWKARCRCAAWPRWPRR